MSTKTRTVDLYFDFVSPYSYLALISIEEFGAANGIGWRLRPVVYGALLDATGLIGPAEIEIKRRYTFRDVTRTAQMLGVPLVGPPAHPFRSLEALRTVCLFEDEPGVLRLAVALAHACWGESRDLTDLDVLRDAVAEVGLDPTDLAKRIGAPGVKRGLRDSTEQALTSGVFGVPMFALEGELFWGHDRMDQLAAYVAGTIGDSDHAAVLENRPRGADRRSSPMRPGCSDG